MAEWFSMDQQCAFPCLAAPSLTQLARVRGGSVGGVDPPTYRLAINASPFSLDSPSHVQAGYHCNIHTHTHGLNSHHLRTSGAHLYLLVPFPVAQLRTILRQSDQLSPLFMFVFYQSPLSFDSSLLCLLNVVSYKFFCVQSSKF